MKKFNKTVKIIIYACLLVFILMNIVAYIQAYKFTHFETPVSIKKQNSGNLSFGQTLKAIFTGISNPRPYNNTKPNMAFETIILKSNKEIECWLIKKDSSKGTVILFHGYHAKKSDMLERSEIFLNLGYNTMLVDFMGSGGSEGNLSTIGYCEAEEVKTAFKYLSDNGEKNIVLFGNSMGSVAVMKAMNDYKLNPKSIIIECPFGSMLQTTKARFNHMHIPVFPMAYLLVFWGGIQNGFNAYKHKPVDYAKSINCPTLLLWGGIDENVSKQEIDNIYSHLKGIKKLKIYQKAKHEDYLIKYKGEWINDVKSFLDWN